MDQVATEQATREAVDAVRQLDHRQLAAMPDPYPLINSLREGCPVGHAETYDGFWNIFRYADVCAVALDAATFSNRDVTIPSENFPVPPPPIMSDPPVHMQFRKPFLKRFSPAVVAELEPGDAVREANDFLAQALAAGYRAGLGHAVPDRMFWAANEGGDGENATAASPTEPSPPSLAAPPSSPSS